MFSKKAFHRRHKKQEEEGIAFEEPISSEKLERNSLRPINNRRSYHGSTKADLQEESDLEAKKISIISFWRHDQKSQTHECYHFFCIEGLQKIGRANEFLLRSEDNDIFLVYQKTDQQMNLGILNLENHSNKT